MSVFTPMGACTRPKFTEQAWFLFYNFSDEERKSIIETYNQIRPLPRGYKLSSSDPWCAAFVSVCSYMCNGLSIVYPECSVGEMMRKYQSSGNWIEDDLYIPDEGDLIFYDWQDTGNGDNTGAPDHIGIVVDVSGMDIRVIEGNYGNAVKIRNMTVGGKYIRGYATPEFWIDSEDEASDAKVWATARGLIRGYGDNDYHWHDAPTREQLAVILYRFWKEFL